MNDRADKSDGDGEFTPVGRSIERLVRHMGGPPVTVLTQLADRWPDIVGPGLADHTRPMELVDSVLIIGAEDGAWASQLSWMESQIIENFHRVFSTASKGPSDKAELIVKKLVVRVVSD